MSELGDPSGDAARIAWLVTGARGQLGTDLLEVLSSRPDDVVTGLGRAELDLTDEAAVRSAVRDWLSGAQADRAVLVNAAAYTAVDAAETDEATAEVVNGRAPGWLAEELAGRGRLVHVSTDYVFDGAATEPYAVDAPIAPRSAYGRTKASGEQAVAAAGGDASVVRTAWVYGRHGGNFVRTMVRLEGQHETLTVVDDQVGSPTWSADLAAGLVELGARKGAVPPVLHFTNAGQVSWCGFARAVFEELGADPERVRPITTAEFPRPAPRPAYSVLDGDAWTAAGFSPRPPMADGLARGDERRLLRPVVGGPRAGSTPPRASCRGWATGRRDPPTSSFRPLACCGRYGMGASPPRSAGLAPQDSSSGGPTRGRLHECSVSCRPCFPPRSRHQGRRSGAGAEPEVRVRKTAGATRQRSGPTVPPRGITGRMADGARALRRAAPPPAVWIAGALLLLTTMVWAALTPATRAPDEPQHLNSILRIANGGGWPEPGDARLESEVVDIITLSGAIHDGARTWVPGAIVAPTGALFTDLSPTGVDDRDSLAELDPGPSPTRTMDQMTQHPPGYYAVTAVAFKVVGAENWRYDRALYFLRFLTGLSIAATVPLCLYLVTRDITGREWTAQAAAFLPLLIPQLGFVGGSVTNDGLTIAAASVLVAALVRLMTAGPTTRRLLVVAVATGAVCWTKGTALTLLPVVPIALAIAYRRAAPGGDLRSWTWPFLRNSSWVLGLAFVLGGWWWALNIVRYGRVQPQAYETPRANGPVLDFGDFFVDQFQRRVSGSFFGNIGLLEAPMPVGLTRTLTIVLLLLLAVGLVTRRHVGERAVFVVGIALTFGVLLATTYSAHRVSHTFPGQQGRYLFVLLVPLLVLVAMGLDRLVRLGRLPERFLLALVAVVGMGVAVTGLLLAFEIYYLADGQSVGRALDLYLGWSAWSWSVVAALLGAMMACGLALAFVLGRTSTGRGVQHGEPRARDRMDPSLGDHRGVIDDQRGVIDDRRGWDDRTDSSRVTTADGAEAGDGAIYEGSPYGGNDAAHRSNGER